MVGIVIALYDEALPILKRLSFVNENGIRHYRGRLARKEVAVFLCKPGVASLSKVRRFLSLYDYEYFLNIGYAGALKPGLQVGDVLVPHTFKKVGLKQNELKPIASGFEQYGIGEKGRGCVIVSADKPVFDSAEKAQLALDADIVDMESYKLAKIFHEQSVPSLIVKIIGDSLDDSFLESETHFRNFFSTKNPKEKFRIWLHTGVFSAFKVYSRKKKLQKILLRTTKSVLQKTIPRAKRSI